jgi:hypothetical protein
MRRFLLGIVALAGALVLAAACDDGGDNNYDGSGNADSCNQLRSCGTCTPVNGCGWCTFSDGTGACVADPSECDTAPTFTWTWNADGCRAAADASVTSSDATPTTDAPATATTPEAASTASPDATEP